MRPPTSLLPPILAGTALLGLLPAVLAHGSDDNNMMGGHAGHGGGGGMNMTPSEADLPLPADQYPPTYFALEEHKTLIYGHIALMILGWVFLLPAAVMLSLARSRYAPLSQIIFAAVNAGGLLLAVVYNAATAEDLYPGNVHHGFGWVISVILGVQIIVGGLGRVAGKMSKPETKAGIEDKKEDSGFIPVSTKAMAEHESRYNKETNNDEPYGRRFSDDSGQGTEIGTESLRGGSRGSVSSPPQSPTVLVHGRYATKEQEEYDDFEDEDLGEETTAMVSGMKKGGKANKVAAKVASKISDRLWKVLMFGYDAVDRTILILGFVALCTGVATYGRFFEGGAIFSGLAHWIKGGVFFWLGIFTLGRWAGSFGELGWAWNVAPRRPDQGWRPSAEFMESFLIFFYGSTNIFLEHLGGWGGEWSSQDLEHVSITVLFIGGGLCGMLIESVRIRTLLNHTVAEAAETETESEKIREPETYSFSMNPIPALVILLLGIMMSSHTQESMVSSMVHKQWGNLLTGASFARAFTYVLVYLKPPRSVFPSRPPTELLAAFGLISGGIIFMASAADTIKGMIHYQLDAMFMYTVTMGFVGLLMAWVIICVAIKGWASRVEAAAEKKRMMGERFSASVLNV
ncbi:hypothetical protein QBC42DRAFT_171759 [Cladorrhinum samala]|uniref:Integral membrane protein n=1 Tax=Cladorrhinum samala TaxID=585594 RepID=A0AAV9HVT2_9PEZI|nr:hypothetical protein QBC42DRAFT_171759 [Cladorrhinum samala]